MPIELSDLRILHATGLIDREAPGGTAIRTIDVAEQLAVRSATTSIVSTDPQCRTVTRTRMNGVAYIGIPATRRYMLPKVSRSTFDDLVASHDVLHLINHWSMLNVMLAAAAQRLGKPYVVCPAGSLPISGRSKHLKRGFNLVFGERLVKRAAGWIAVVEHECIDFGRFGISRDDIAIIPNAADPAKTRSDGPPGPIPRPIGAIGEDYVLFVGRLDPIKGPDLLLDAFIRIADSVSFDLVIAGPDMGLRSALEARARASEVGDRIHFCGYVAGDVKDRLIANAKALVIPSRSDAMSIVVLEAGVLATTVLATAACGLDGLLSGGAGSVVSADAAGLAQGLVDLDHTDTAAAGIELQGRVVRDYGWDTIADLYRSLYATALERRRGDGEVPAPDLTSS